MENKNRRGGKKGGEPPPNWVPRHKGTGFCEYPDVDTAQAAIRNLNKYGIRGRELICDWADNELKSKYSVSKILSVEQGSSAGKIAFGAENQQDADVQQGWSGNRILGLMKRSELEVLKVDPQDTGLLGEMAQVLHQLTPAQLAFLIRGGQEMLASSGEAGTKAFLKEHPLLAHALVHACFLTGMADESSLLRDPKLHPPGAPASQLHLRDGDDLSQVFSIFEEDGLKRRCKVLRSKLFGVGFEGVKKNVVSSQFIKKLEKLSQGEVFEYVRLLLKQFYKDLSIHRESCTQ